jgi:tetratricopeptide (TPR) repeat protein
VVVGGRLVGRDRVLDELTAIARRAAAGSGSLVLVVGEAGMGKTSVARALADRVGHQLAVSWGTCVAEGSAPPFWPWREVLAESATRVATGTVAPADAAGASRFELLARLGDELAGRAAVTPLLHVIEDVQWADVVSVLLLRHVSAHVARLPLMIVATLRTGETLMPSLADAIEDVRRAAEVFALTPLADDDTAALMREVGLAPVDGLAAVVNSRTGGNPLFVTELLRMVRSSTRTEDPATVLAAGVPDRVAELVMRRVERLPPAVRDVVVTASVIGSQGRIASLAAVHRTGQESMLDLFEQARAARLVDLVDQGSWRFLHDLVRDAVYAGVPAPARAQRHAAVVEALAEDATGAASALARHALAALPFFDADRAVALAARAGTSAFDHRAYEEAVTWFERALEVAPPETSSRWRAELLVRSGEANRHVGQIEAARRCFLEASACTDDPALLAATALGYADPGADLGIAFRADAPVTGALLERAIAAQPAHDSTTTVLLEARLAAELHFSDDPGRARVLATTAVERARRLGDARALGAAHAVHHDAFVFGQADQSTQLAGSQQLLEWARSDGSVAALLTAHRARVFDLLAAGELTEMDTEILAFRRIADPLQAPGYLWWPSLWSAMRSLLEGRHDEAEARAVDAYAIGARQFPSLALLNLSFLLFFLRREQGRAGEMEQATRDYAAGNPDVPALRVGLAFLLAELGRIDEAAGMLSGFDDAALARLRDRNWPASWFQLARASMLVGDRRLAGRLVDAATRPSERCVTVSLATVCLGAADLATAWLLHTLGEHGAADAHYRAAESTNARIGARSWLAQTRADHARLLLDRDQAGDRDEARRSMGMAAEAAEAIGLRSLARSLDDLATRLETSPVGDRIEPASPACTFRRAGAVWELQFAGHTVQLPHSRGLIDIACLLARPGAALSVWELLDEPGGRTGEPRAARGAPAFDQRARQEIGARLRALDAAIAEAEDAGDEGRAGVLREELQQLAEAVARDTGLGGRPRLVGDPLERARKTVTARIRRSITQIGRAHPELGRHLERSIDTGTWCAYRPAQPTTWIT